MLSALPYFALALFGWWILWQLIKWSEDKVTSKFRKDN